MPVVSLRWISVGAGRLALSRRPKLKDVATFPDMGCTRVVTIQGQNESAMQIGRAVEQAGLAWTWIPVGHGKSPQGEEDRLLRRALPALDKCLDVGESILIHCSAGIHRTGMLTFALLRWRGESEESALTLIAQMRLETRQGLQDEHLAWGNLATSER
ncbi:MAG: dual specificity protein phosphatase family protein [Planctomycetes bacterium]|nr:dual specificity protein phosphatase family protein [Planctomycetota bacterium]